MGVILLAARPRVIYKLYPPEIKASAEVPAWAGEELKEMGGLTLREALMSALVILALARRCPA